MTERRVKIAPSILSADFATLGNQVMEAEAGGADYIHIDVMDGRFVPPLTFGPMIVKAIRNRTSLPLDVHMMVMDPGKYVEELAEAGADLVTVHAESPIHLRSVVRQVKEAEMNAGVALSPATPPSAVEEVLPDLDAVLVMTVNPGYGGQAFIEGMVDKIRRMRAMLDERGLHALLGVDGGISAQTAGRAASAGADFLVAGSAIYGVGRGVAEAIAEIRSAAMRG